MVPRLSISAPALKFHLQVAPEAMNNFVQWQGDLHEALAATNGFVSLEIIAPSATDKFKWKIAIRFVNDPACSNWQRSENFLNLMAVVKPLLAPGFELKIEEENSEDEASSNARVTELFITNLLPGKELEFRAWIAKIHQAEAKFPGFSGVYIQSPPGNSKYWITFLQFDSQKHLDFWLSSPERQGIIEQSQDLLDSLESHRVITSFPGWFNSIVTGNVGVPPLWKQAMLIVLVLFPIVMLERKFLNPVTSSLNSSLAMFIGNVLSVSLVTWPFMPLMIRWMGWWLAPENGNDDIKGAVLILALYAVEVLVFALVG